MNPPVFCSSDLEPVDGMVTLRGAEAHHAINVQRIRSGEVVDLVDGRGLRLRVIAVDVEGSDALTCRVESSRREPRSSPRVTVVQALIKDGELAVDLLTQAGADRIVPWAAERSVVRWRADRAERAQAKWQSAADQAAKQSRRAWWPTVEPVHTTDQIIALCSASGQVLLLDAAATTSMASLPIGDELVVIVGPEGDVTPREAAAFVAAGALPVHLGPQVWRSSSAGMAALTLAAAVNSSVAG